MKKCILLLTAILFLVACEKENLNYSLSEKEAVNFKTHAQSIDVCHFDAINDTWKVIKISENALKAHLAHGDAVDMDEDGYFNTENGCSEVDCDDTIYDVGNSFCEKEYEIEFEGSSLFVALEDEGIYTWQEAINACAAKAASDGNNWYLPNKAELNALHIARNDIGGFTNDVYWSSTEFSENTIYSWTQHFNTIYDGNQVIVLKEVALPCRCVRK